MNETESPPRLTPTQRLHEVTLAALNRPAPSKSPSVEIGRNAKGDWTFTVDDVQGEDETLQALAARVLSVAGDLDKKLPLSRSQIYGRETLPNEREGK